jgi:hypothetical protein
MQTNPRINARLSFQLRTARSPVYKRATLQPHRHGNSSSSGLANANRLSRSTLKAVDLNLRRPTMKKIVTPALFAVALLLLCSVPMLGQAAQPGSQSGTAATPPNSVNDKDVEMLRQDLRDQRKQIVALNLPLSGDEASKFWPVFDQYRKDAIKPNDERWAVIKEYAASYDTMTDAQAQSLMNRSDAVDQQLLALRMRYVPIFEKVISPKKTALFYQIDRRIDLMINLQLASTIPMVNPTAK